jgi:hypothetical protein
MQLETDSKFIAKGSYAQGRGCWCREESVPARKHPGGAEGFLLLCGRERPLKKVLTFMATAIQSIPLCKEKLKLHTIPG